MIDNTLKENGKLIFVGAKDIAVDMPRMLKRVATKLKDMLFTIRRLQLWIKSLLVLLNVGK